MRFFAISALLIGSAVATQLNERFLETTDPLAKRQGGQFVPGTTTAQGSSCEEAFGPGYVTCREKTATRNRLCYSPGIGQTCCSNTWACPSGSFCLTDPYCCPNGQDPKTCAAEKGLTLPSDFKTDGTASPTGKFPAGNVTEPKPTGAGTAPVTFFTGAADKLNVGMGAVAGLVGLAGLL